MVNQRSPLLPPKSEAQEQRELATWLDHIGLCWFHPANEGRRTPRQGAMLKAQGMKSGVPDVVILSKPPKAPGARGVAIELKVKGGKVSAAQDEFLRRMRNCEWLTYVCYGSSEAIRYLEQLGYGYAPVVAENG